MKGGVLAQPVTGNRLVLGSLSRTINILDGVIIDSIGICFLKSRSYNNILANKKADKNFDAVFCLPCSRTCLTFLKIFLGNSFKIFCMKF